MTNYLSQCCITCNWISSGISVGVLYISRFDSHISTSLVCMHAAFLASSETPVNASKVIFVNINPIAANGARMSIARAIRQFIELLPFFSLLTLCLEEVIAYWMGFFADKSDCWFYSHDT